MSVKFNEAVKGFGGRQVLGIDRPDHQHPIPAVHVLGKGWVAMPGVHPSYYCVASDSFIGADFMPLWSKAEAGAGAATLISDESLGDGVAKFALSAADESQSAGLFWNNVRSIPLSAKPIFEARLRVSVLPTTGTEQSKLRVGLISDFANDIDSVTYRALVGIDSGAGGSGSLLGITDDNATAKSVALGKTITATDWFTVRIDLSDLTEPKFYVNDVRHLTAASGFTLSDASTQILQPFLGITKTKSSANTATGTLLVDWVHVQWIA